MRPIVLILAASLLAACAAMDDQREPPATAAPVPVGAGERCVTGMLTGDGVECPAMQALDGEVFTLIGDLDGREPGDLVCACGRVAEMSTCMQGTTLELTRIGSPAICP